METSTMQKAFLEKARIDKTWSVCRDKFCEIACHVWRQRMLA
jgi:hypothetical protein